MNYERYGHSGHTPEQGDPVSKPEPTEGERKELQNIIDRLDAFADKPWFRHFMNAAFTPTRIIIQGVDKIFPPQRAKAPDAGDNISENSATDR